MSLRQRRERLRAVVFIDAIVERLIRENIRYDLVAKLADIASNMLTEVSIAMNDQTFAFPTDPMNDATLWMSFFAEEKPETNPST